MELLQTFFENSQLPVLSAFLLGLILYGKGSRHPALQAVQVIIIIIFGWVAWKAEGIETLVGYFLGSFYIVRLIFPPKKAKLE